MTFDGVIDPIPPSVDQCIQVVCDPSQAGLSNHAYDSTEAKRAPKEAYLVPRNVVVLSTGKKWSPQSGVKRSRVDRNSPVLPVIAGRISADYKNTTGKGTLRVLGVSIDGIQNGAAAQKNPDAAGRMSVQMHGVATVFCAKDKIKAALKNAKFGDPVVVDMRAEAVKLRGITGEFHAFQVMPWKTGVDTSAFDNADVYFIGWLVDVGPADRNELRVHLDQHWKPQVTAVPVGAGASMADETITLGSPQTDNGAAPAAAPAIMPAVHGVAVAALSVPAADTQFGIPHGTVLVTAGMTAAQLKTAALRAESQEPATGMDADRYAALLGDGGQTPAVRDASAKVLLDFYTGKPHKPSATSAVTLGGSLVPASTLTDDVIKLATSEAGAPPPKLLQQTCMETGGAITSLNAAVLPEHYDVAKWKQALGELMADYKDAGPVSTMKAGQLTKLLDDARNKLQQ